MATPGARHLSRFSRTERTLHWVHASAFLALLASGLFGLVLAGQTSGAKMHRTRYTARQRMLDVTGNLKAVQALLGHASIIEAVGGVAPPDPPLGRGGMTGS